MELDLASDTMEWESEQPPLFRLPGELKNKIYRSVLVSDRSIEVDSSGLQEPALLLACKQSRREAMGIFYGENEFIIQHPNYDGSTPVKWTRKARSIKAQCKVQMNCMGYCAPGSSTGTPHWATLLLWLKRYHDNSVLIRFPPPSRVPAETPVAQTILGVMFEIARGLRTRPWAEVETLLEEHHHILVKLDPRWR